LTAGPGLAKTRGVKLFLLVLCSVLTLAACEKASDIPALQQELTGIAANYKQKLDELEQRGKRLAEHLNKVGSNAPRFDEAQTAFVQAGRAFTRLRDVATRVPNDVATALKANKPEALRAIAEQLKPSKNPADPNNKATDVQLELTRVMDALQSHLEDGYTEVNSTLDAVDGWIATVESLPAAPAPPPTTPPTDTNGSSATP
jgi:hypothetical protein